MFGLTAGHRGLTWPPVSTPARPPLRLRHRFIPLRVQFSTWRGLINTVAGFNHRCSPQVCTVCLFLFFSTRIHSNLPVAVNERSPFQTLLTHGFVLDEQGKKMSKSLGNVIDPALVVSGGKDKTKQPAHGVDVLRMWVAATDYTSDINIGPTILAKVSETQRKIRNTLRFALTNLADFDPAKNAVPLDELSQVCFLFFLFFSFFFFLLFFFPLFLTKNQIVGQVHGGAVAPLQRRGEPSVRDLRLPACVSGFSPPGLSGPFVLLLRFMQGPSLR